MLRIKRSVAATYSLVSVAAPVAEPTPAGGAGAKRGREESGLDTMEALEAEAAAVGASRAAAGGAGATHVSGFVSAGIYQQGSAPAGVGSAPAGGAAGAAAAAAAAANPEEIDVDVDIDEGAAAGGDGDMEEEDADLETKAVPSEVFGSLAGLAAQQAAAASGGADAERVKRQKR